MWESYVAPCQTVWQDFFFSFWVCYSEAYSKYSENKASEPSVLPFFAYVYHYFHGFATNLQLRKMYNFQQNCNFTTELFFSKKYFENIRLDGGSDWVVISREFAEFALSNQELPRGLRLFFSSVLLPVESFFHTVGEGAYFYLLFFNSQFLQCFPKNFCCVQ